MISRRLPLLLLFVATFSSIVTANEFDTKGAFSYYQSVISHKASGVYEWNGFLFVHARMPFDRRKGQRAKARLAATLKLTDLLYEWALKHTAESRESDSEKLPEGMALVRKVVLECNPHFLCRDWKISVRVREFPEQVDIDSYSLGQVFEVSALEESLPESIGRPLTTDQWFKALQGVCLERLSGESRYGLLVACSAFDGVGDGLFDSLPDDTNGKSEYLKVASEQKKYLAGSVLAEKFRSRQKRIQGQKSSSTLVVRRGEPVVKEEICVSVVTNLEWSGLATTNSIVRQQTKEEELSYGRVVRNEVTDLCVDESIGEVVSTVTRTIVETVKCPLHKVTHTVSADAKFEDIFLAGGQKVIECCQQTRIGAGAVQVFYADTSMEEKMKTMELALAENPYDKELWNLYGRCYLKKGDSRAALICFRVSVSLDNDYEFAWTNLAETYKGLGQGKLSFGAAVIARILAKDAWCVKHSEAILLTH